MGIFTQLREAADATLSAYIQKAKDSVKKKDEFVIERKSFTSDDAGASIELGYKDRPSAVTFEILNQMAMRDSIIAAIIQTRVNQIKTFGQAQPDKYSPGFKFILRDDEKEPDEKNKEEMQLLEHWILNTGCENDRPISTVMNFTELLGILTRDLLKFDQVAIETINAQDGSLAYFSPSASGTVRYSTKNLSKNKDLIAIYNHATDTVDISDDASKEKQILERDQKRTDEEYRWVQVHDGRIVRAFFDDELVVKMMNPVTDISAYGYSVGPLEYLANIVSYHLFTEAHNKLFFVQGFASRGIMHIEGDVPATQLEGFRRQWREQVSGASNSWRTPILAGGSKINWVPLQMSNRDMEFSSWMEYLIKIMCALYAITPGEINFDITREGGSSLGESGSRQESLFRHSRSRGLAPILKFYEGIINENLLKRFDPEAYKKYKFVFCGVDTETRTEELERHEKEVKIWRTVNEIRKEHDAEEIEGGDILLSPEYMSWYQNFSKEGKDKAQNDVSQMAQDQGGGQPGDEQIPTDLADNSQDTEVPEDLSRSLRKGKRFKKPELLKIEYFTKK